jgi:hypothetical protein
MKAARHARARRAVLLTAVASLGAGASGCGLLLGIDDVPALMIAEAGAPDVTHDHYVAHEARADTGVDATPDRAVADAGMDRFVATDVGPDVVDGGHLPVRSGSQTTSDASINFALHQLWFGDTDPTSSFTVDPSAWASFGYNIDGKITTESSTDVCTLASNALPSVQIDGNFGADDSFGENLVTDLSFAYSGGFSQSLTGDVERGSYTMLFDTTGLSSSPTQTNVGLTTQIYGGSSFNGTPTFTLADNWPVNPATLADGVDLANGSKLSLSDSYVVNGTWVSGEPTDLSFTISVEGHPLVLTFHHTVVTFQHVVDDAGASHAVNGMLAGILKPQEFINAANIVAGNVNNGQDCSIIAAFTPRILSAQDIMEDGTNSPGEACNGISVALAFTADEIQLPSSVGPADTMGSGRPCGAEAGAPDAGPG